MKTIFKGIYVLGIAVLITSCSGSGDDKKEILKTKKEELKELKAEIDKLKSEIVDTSDAGAYAVPVEVKKMIPEVFHHVIEVSGEVEARYQALVSPEINGQIQTIHVEEGDRVSKGQTLVSLKTDVTQKSIDEVKTGLELATTMYEKQKELWEQKIGSEVQYLQAKNQKESLEGKLETLKAQLRMAIVTAPFSGIVDEIYRKKGELAGPGMQLIQLVNLKQLNINAKVSESYLADIHKGDTVTVEFPSFPKIKLHEPIYRIGNVIDPGSRTIKVQVRLQNNDEILKPNLMSVLHINDYTADSAMVVPSIIVKKDLKGYFLFVAENKEGEIHASKRYVEPGKSYKDETEILSGLKPDDMVIVTGYNLVSTGTTVEIQ